jgi:TonB family protein
MRNPILQVAIVVLSASSLLAASVQEQPTVLTMSERALVQNRIVWLAPIFPPIARAAHAGGPVVVDIEIDERGNVASARVVSGHPLLQAAMLQAVREWKFRPVKLNHIPVRVTGRVTHVFRESKPPPPEETSVEARERQVKKNPNSFEARNELGRAYLEVMRFGDAVLQFSAAIRIKPNSAAARVKLGNAYYGLGSYEQALQVLSEAVRIDPDSSEAFQAIGLTQLKLEKYETAAEAFKKSLEVKDPAVSSHFLLGKSLLLLDRHDEAVIAYKAGLAKDPESAMGHFGLGEVFLELEKYADAITELNEAIKLSDGQGASNSHFYLGMAYLGSGDREAAWKQYEILKRLNQDLAERLLEAMRTLKKREVGA